MRQVVLDTETTGLDWAQGHRVIEIGCVEIFNRRRTGSTWHVYLNPERSIDQAAQDVHGLSLEMLADKPRFREISDEFLEFLGTSELLIHNAPFDLGFLDSELRLSGDSRQLSTSNPVLDTLELARQMNPGQRNSLDALCKRHGIDNSRRDLHGALLDAQLLADVYLAMTGGQGVLTLSGVTQTVPGLARSGAHASIQREGLQLVRLQPSASDMLEHEAYLEMIDKASGGRTVWRGVSS